MFSRNHALQPPVPEEVSPELAAARIRAVAEAALKASMKGSLLVLTLAAVDWLAAQDPALWEEAVAEAGAAMGLSREETEAKAVSFAIVMPNGVLLGVDENGEVRVLAGDASPSLEMMYGETGLPDDDAVT